MPSMKSGTILNGRHQETIWMYETPLPGGECITWVTQKLLKVVASGNLTVWDIFMTLTNILKPPFFWGMPKECLREDRWIE